MKLKITPRSVEIIGSDPLDGLFGDFDEVEIILRDGSSMRVDLNKTFWIGKLLEAHDQGDWQSVDTAIQNMRLNYESKNHA